MAKKRAAEPEETKLKKKIAAKLTDHKSSQEGDTALRSLKKRLKREQRKRRALAQRKKQAAGNKAEAATA